MKIKKNAFTLIELLAVIVILAIIALIATPIILGIIKDAKEEANKRSVDNYAKAIQNSIVKYQLSDGINITGKFSPKALENKKLSKTIITNESSELKIEYDGNVICEQIEIYDDGNIFLGNCIVNGDNVDYTYGIKRYSDGEIVYFNVKKGKSCTNYHEDNSKTGYNGIYEGETSRKTTDNQNNCLKFYAFNDNGGETLNLLLDHNTTALVAWASTSSNSQGPSKESGYILDKLYNDTKEWSDKIITPKDYTMNQKEQKSKAYYTIEYSRPIEGETKPYKARLITAQEIAQITGADKKQDLLWDEQKSTSDYFFETLITSPSVNCRDNDESTKCKYGWLYDRTSRSCTTYGCLNKSDVATSGYWTASSYVSSSGSAWMIGGVGYVHAYSVVSEFGVRPVIIVLKINL